MNRKILLIDGSSMLVTNYYGNLPKAIMFAKTEEEKEKLYDKIMHNSKGVYTNAVYGMLRTVLKIIKNQQPTHIAFAFDKTRDTFRREIYADYKGTRSETPRPLKDQFILMEDILTRLGFKVLMSDKYEADDLIGSLAKKIEGSDTPVYIMTKDHDYMQLASEYTRLWMVQTKAENADALFAKYAAYGADKKTANLPDKVFEYTPFHVKMEEKVYPSQIVDLKGIVGDTSDNIPGVKGVASAAIPLLNEYGTIENIYEEIDNCHGDKKEIAKLNKFFKEELKITRSPINALTKTSEEGKLLGREAAYMSKKLATIVTDIELDIELKDIEAHIDEDELKAVIKELEFKSLE